MAWPLAAFAQSPKMIDAGGAADVTTLTAKIEAVDQANRTVTVKGKMGHVVTFNVGDTVKVTYTEAVIVDVFTPGAAKN